MASYWSERSFILILSARDDLVKVSCKSDARKCQNQVIPSLLLPVKKKAPAPLALSRSDFHFFILVNFKKKLQKRQDGVERFSSVLLFATLPTLLYLVFSSSLPPWLPEEVGVSLTRISMANKIFRDQHK